MSNAAVFGKRKEPHTIIIAQGNRISHFTIRPWMAAIGASLVAAMAVGYLLATSYLMLRDDILNAAIARQARMQHAYEDRIAALRSQVDRITSYRLLDQQLMETKVAELLDRQSMLADRSGRLAPLLEKAQLHGIAPMAKHLDDSDIPVPAAAGATGKDPARTIFRPQKPIAASMQRASADPETLKDDLRVMPIVTLSKLGASLNDLEADQINRISALADSTRAMREQIVADARNAGLPLKTPAVSQTGTGGPFIPADPSATEDAFDQELETLNEELDALDKVRGAILTFPIANPAPGNRISSSFGNRRDPILNRSAFHAGIDLATPSGTNVRATGSGTVVHAGRNGGYGKMVEIRHANGLKTRYAHLSRILVKSGQKVAAGTIIGKSGSTGRSTGPHLHYEVRENDKAVNPATYIRAGRRLSKYL
ncbi:M23 family metallopeptidase [Oricola sp.]|uniref:M23 family metallopeptidase n=1 Tax=Oricola sp. TaxID=1979950 RepID=UPI0025F62311|nr:M23 family metallopeptidase [Oricola sp.]MCI5073920.1 M23 family metallopeptidase [Oricola sp.]